MTPRHLKLVLLATGCLVAVGGCSGQGIGTNQYVAVCGDGLRERTEQCDGADLGGHSCQTIGYSDGTLGCLPDCTFDWSDCYIIDTCGNGVFDQPMEECDGPFLNGATCVDLGYDEGTVACSVSCKRVFRNCFHRQGWSITQRQSGMSRPRHSVSCPEGIPLLMSSSATTSEISIIKATLRTKP